MNEHASHDIDHDYIHNISILFQLNLNNCSNITSIGTGADYNVSQLHVEVALDDSAEFVEEYLFELFGSGWLSQVLEI